MIPLPLVLALLLAPQAEQPSPAAPPTQTNGQTPERRNPVLEGVAVQAGEQLVTLGEFERLFKRMQELRPQASREEEEQLFRRTLLELWNARLEAQKGADLGLDPTQIARISRLNLQTEREKAGLQNYLTQLRAEGKDAQAEDADRQQEILGAMWQYKALGNGFAGRRATRDVTIRPGELRAIFEENKKNLAPVTVQLRWLIVASESAGSPDAARASCEDARLKVLEGEDLALLVEERGNSLRDSRGLLPFRPPEAFPDPAVVKFGQEAEIGGLSEVTAVMNPKTNKPDPSLGYQLIQLHDRNTPPEPEFDSPDVQRTLRGYFQRQRRDQILGRAREELQREAYSWVNPLAAPRAPSAPAPR